MSTSPASINLTKELRSNGNSKRLTKRNIHSRKLTTHSFGISFQNLLSVGYAMFLRIQNLNDQFEERININSFFPTRALLLEIGFVLSKFIGFYICLNTFYASNTLNVIFLLVIFSLSWSLGLVVPAAPGGVGVFEACLLLFVGKSIPQNIIIISLVYFRVISTSADLFLSLPFLIRKLYKRI